jgi:hypothetical protein
VSFLSMLTGRMRISCVWFRYVRSPRGEPDGHVGHVGFKLGVRGGSQEDQSSRGN